MIRVLFVLVLLWSSWAQAETISATANASTANLRWRATNQPSPYSTTPHGACTYYGFYTTDTQNSYSQWKCKNSIDGTPSGYLVNAACLSGSLSPVNGYASCGAATYTCPSGQNWTLSGTNCTRPDCAVGEVRNLSTGVCELAPCPEGQHHEGTECVSDCADVAGTSSSSVSLINPAPQMCVDGCSAVWSASSSVTAIKNGVRHTVATGKYTFSDSVCTASDSIPPSETPDNTCASGQVLITRVDGYQACATALDGQESVNNAPQSTSSTTESTNTTDNTRTVEKTTTAADGSKTTESTIYNATTGQEISRTISGSGAVPAKTESMSDFCTANPAAGMCGDQESLSEFCATHPDHTVCQTVGTAPEEGEFGTQSRSFTAGPLFGGHSGTCPADKILNVAGQSIAVPYGLMCDFAGWLRPLVLVAAWLSAAALISGSLKGEA